MARARYFFVRIWNATDGLVGWALLLGLLASITEGLSLALLIPILGSVSGASPSPYNATGISKQLESLHWDLPETLLTFVMLVIFQALISSASSISSTCTLLGGSDRLRSEFFSSVARARWDAVQDRRVSDLNLILNGEISRVQVAIGAMLSFLQSAIMLCIYFALALLVSWQMALFALVLGIAMFSMLYPIRKRAGVFGEELGKLYSEQQATLLEFLTGLRVAKIFDAEERYSAQYWRQIAAVRHRTLRFARLSNLGNFSQKVFSGIAVSLFIFISVEYLRISFPQLVVLLAILLRIAPRFGSLHQNAQELANNLAAYEKVERALFELNSAAEPILENNDLALVPTKAIQFRRTSFQYPNTAGVALNDISLEIPVGTICAIIGPSGSGKSTLADLVMGLLSPTAGAVLLDDVPVTDANRRAWRRQVAFVPQEPVLFNDSIAANLRIAEPDSSDEELWAALERANARKFVSRLPNKLETVVGERGARLSGGERQRLTLARALLRRPKVLILDEATSALDWETQQTIAADISQMRGKFTIIMIAHRPSMVSFADMIIALENGRVAEVGTYNDLAVRRESRLAQMIRAEGGAGTGMAD